MAWVSGTCVTGLKRRSSKSSFRNDRFICATCVIYGVALIASQPASKHVTIGDKSLLSAPQMALALSAEAFSVSAPAAWNSLSYNCRSAQLLGTLRHIQWRNQGPDYER